MPPTFTIKQNDQLPSIQATCVDADGQAVDLTGATGVNFHMKALEGGVAKVNAAGVIVDDELGIVRYDWASADTDTIGEFLAEFEVVFAGPKTQTFPNFENILITIVDDLA
jgi:hypothetical protein